MRAKNLVSITVGLTLILAACSSGSAQPSKTTPRPASQAAQDLPAEASSADRIDAALNAGEIDESVAAMYRVWAMFSDPSLPAEFQSETPGIDSFTLATIGASLDEYSDEARAELEPFFKRPSDPDSAFSDPDASNAEAASLGQNATVTLAAVDAGAPSAIKPAENGDDTEDEEEPPKPKRCTNWETEVVPDLPFRVWACADGLDAPAAIAAVSEVLQNNAGEMIAEFPNGMGAPIPDEPEGEFAPDELIDFYVLPQGWMAPKRGLNERVADEQLAGVAMDADPMDEHTSSAYLLIAAYLLEFPEALERVVVHELFHALQFAHYRSISLENRWIYEGTGFWSERYFTDQEPTHTYFYRIGEMQNSALGLADSDFQHSYSTFIWFTFLQQQQGPQAVFSFWKKMGENPPPEDTALWPGAMGPGFEMQDEFPEFAMRLLNVQLPGDPISPRFSDFDPDFPDDSTPDLSPVNFEGNELALDGQGIPALGYRYTLVSFAEETSVAMSHDLANYSGISPVVEALVPDADGTYERVRLGEDAQSFCVSGDVYFVFSNPSISLADSSEGLLTLAPDDGQGCGDAPTSPDESPEGELGPALEPEAEPEPEASGYCPDMGWLNDQLEDLVANPRGLDADYVSEMFAIADPYLYDMVDGGRGHIGDLQAHVEKFIGVDVEEAKRLAADERFNQQVDGFDFLIRYC